MISLDVSTVCDIEASGPYARRSIKDLLSMCDWILKEVGAIE